MSGALPPSGRTGPDEHTEAPRRVALWKLVLAYCSGRKSRGAEHGNSCPPKREREFVFHLQVRTPTYGETADSLHSARVCRMEGEQSSPSMTKCELFTSDAAQLRVRL